jgi:hypothetical protein
MRLSVLVLSLLAPALAQADLLYFEKGGRVELPTRREGKQVILESPMGPLTFDESEFRRIVSRPTPSQEWPDRLKKARAGTSDDRVAAAWWALENGLTDEAVQLIREAHQIDRGNTLAGRLVRVLDELQKPIPDPPDLAQTTKEAGVELKVERGSLALVLYQADPSAARERLRVVEQVATTFLLVFTARGMELHPPRHKLVSIWYQNQVDFVAFLDRSNAGAFRTAQGYYHPVRDVVAAFEAGSNSSHQKGLAAIARRQNELDATEKAINEMPKGARIRITATQGSPQTLTRLQAQNWLKKARLDLARPGLILDLDRRGVDLGLTAHETVHQLVMNTGFATNHDSFPTWLNEGLAAQFEVVRGGRWAGFGRANDQRLPDWRAMVPGPRLPPLLRDEGFGRGYRRELYAQAWALVYFLRIKHPDKFTTFLDKLRRPSKTGPNRAPAQVVEAYRETFGVLAESEADWHRFLREITTPLEESDPNSKSGANHR